MGSKTTKLESVRRRKKTAQGKKRKAQNRTQGTTRSEKELFQD